jgi:hypothetical protein
MDSGHATKATPPPADASSTPQGKPEFSIESGRLCWEESGRKVTIADGVDGFWPIAIDEAGDGGHRALQAVAYAKADGAGGYENEGQSLYLWAPGYREGRKLVAEYFRIQQVDSLQARSGHTVLVIVMKDGGLGATHVGFADPERGELFRADGADVVQHEDGAVRIGWFRDADWNLLGQDASVRPQRSERFDLDALLKRRVMHNATSFAPPSTATSAVRELHRLAGVPNCIEMYTVCDDAGLCTSAPFDLACGESGRSPATGERLRCVCP